jgi:hypothetical protein
MGERMGKRIDLYSIWTDDDDRDTPLVVFVFPSLFVPVMCGEVNWIMKGKHFFFNERKQTWG